VATDPSNHLFQNYLRHYQRNGAELGHITAAQISEYHLERAPRWLDRIPKDARILDAGCATGYLLGLLRDSGYHQLTGVDLSKELTQAAKQSLSADASIVNSDIQSFLAKTPDESFDVIIFHHVLEHIPRDQTINLLREFYRCLKPSGCLNIKVPNASCIVPGNHLFGDFTHIVYFNERSLVQVLEASGMKVDQLEFIPHPPVLFWSWRHPIRAFFRLLNRLRWHLHGTVHKALYILADQFPTPRIFEWEIEVLARK
jgi:SAM-dependent methyltransferase